MDQTIGSLHILLVQEDPKNVEPLRAALSSNGHRFSSENVNVDWASSCDGAIARLRQEVADILIVDVASSKAGGEETLERLQVHFPDIPIIALLEGNGEKSVISSLRKGAQEVVAKDSLDCETLIRRIKQAIQRHKTAMDHLPVVVIPAGESLCKEIALLQWMLDQPDGLAPQSQLDSSCGHSYPAAREIFECKPGEETAALEHLAEGGYLTRQFFDTIHLCAFCSHWALNFRELCPQCKSSNLKTVDLIHHYRCSYVGPCGEFRKGVRMECPKCKRDLRHIGIDYEQPASNYQCGSCAHVFTDARVSCRCLSCGQLFGVERATVRTLYAYRLSSKGAQAAAEGELEAGRPPESLVDERLGVYTLKFLETRLAEESRRLRRSQRPLSLLLLHLDGMQSYEEEFGKEAAGLLVKNLIQVITETLRGCDVTAHFEDRTLAVLLPETGLERAGIAAERIRSKFLESPLRTPYCKPSLSIGMVGIEREAPESAEIIHAASELLDEAREAGGNSIRSATF
jgi:diguanylate cyclase (GGDEF)-like protein